MTREKLDGQAITALLAGLENWTLGDAFAKAFPGLADTYGLKSEGQERRR